MEAKCIEGHRLLSALDALKDMVHTSSDRSRLSLYIYICSFTLIEEALNKQPQALQALPVTMAKVSQWAVEFFSEYEDEEDFDKTFVDFLNWIKLKLNLYQQDLC